MANSEYKSEVFFHFKKIILTVICGTDRRGTKAESIEVIQKTSAAVQVTADGGLEQKGNSGDGEKGTDS